MTHPYYTAAAQLAILKAGGKLGTESALAAWAEAAVGRTDVNGVLLAEDGAVLAETRSSVDAHGQHVGTYVHRVIDDRISDIDQIDQLVADFAAARCARRLSCGVIQVSLGEVTSGNAEAIHREIARLTA